MKLVDTRYLFVNIKDTEYTSYGDFKIPLPSFKSGKNIINHMYIKKSIIPYDWKAFNSTNAFFKIQLGLNAPISYTFTEGNPNIYDLITEFNNLQGYLTASFNRTSSKITWKNNSTSSITLIVGNWKAVGFSSASITIPIGSSTTSPNIVDVAPARILIIKSELPSSGEEVFSSQTVIGDTKDTGILSAICMDVPPYSHKIWRDIGGFYYSYIEKTVPSIRFWFEDVDGNKIVPQTSPFLVIAIETYEDDTGELLTTQREALKLQKYALLLKHSKQSKQKKLDIKNLNTY